MSGLPEPPVPAPSHPDALIGSPFTPIADFAFLSNCHTGALLAPDGSVDWLCVPRFDSPSIFGSLLDRGAGSFRLAPFGMKGSKKISDLLREAGVPSRLRHLYPLVEDDEGPFWLVGVSRAERTRMLPSTATAVTLLIHGWRPDGAEGE